MNLFWLTFSVGLFGSLHCVGMCGPIGLLLPLNRSSNQHIASGLITYNLGRIATYTAMGALFGVLGRSISIGISQQYVSLITGFILLLFSLSHFAGKTQILNLAMPLNFIGKIYSFLKKNKLLQSSFGRFSIGMVNGFLPCGLVYMGIAIAISSGSILGGAQSMFYFGLGTVPLLLSTHFLGTKINGKIRSKLSPIIPYFKLLMALVFVIRGLNLGILFSPKIDVVQAVISICH